MAIIRSMQYTFPSPRKAPKGDLPTWPEGSTSIYGHLLHARHSARPWETAHRKTELCLHRTYLFPGEMTSRPQEAGQVLDTDTLKGLMSPGAGLRRLPSLPSVSAAGKLSVIPGAAFRLHAAAAQPERTETPAPPGFVPAHTLESDSAASIVH